MAAWPSSALALPQVTGLRLLKPAVVGEEAALAVRAVDPDAPLRGFVATLPDGTRFGATACRPADASGQAPGAPFRAGDAVRFVLRPTFTAPGPSGLDVAVISGGCDAPAEVAHRPVGLTVTVPGAEPGTLLPGVPVLPALPSLPAITIALPRASAAASTRCKGANVQPANGGLPLARRATLCLINRERTRRGLRLVHSDRLLKRAATLHTRAMIREGFFSHVGRDGSDMATRILRLGWPSPPGPWELGENLGYGADALATPKAMIRTWMDSTPHRANLLDPRFDRVGIAIALGTPGDPRTGATFTTDYGVVER